MLSIFQKKNYLIDILQDTIDIHNHILPGIDDGAKNVQDSKALLLRLKEFGITNFICTPHIMNDYYPNTPSTINQALELLQKEVSKDPDLKDISLTAAAEYMMDQSFTELLENEKLLTLRNNLLLVEMSYFQAPINLAEILFKIQTRGYRPVLAHPERYAFYHAKNLDKYEDLQKRGCLMQVNALSLSTHYGTKMQKFAFRLLEAGMIDFIGTDTHRLEHLEKLSAIKLNRNHTEMIKKVIANTNSIFTP